MSEARYGGLADQAAAANGIPRDLFRRLVAAESGWRPDAISSAGAIGLGQLMPGTARSLGVNPRDPAENLAGAARYLAEQRATFGRWDLALSAYNAGPGAVQANGNRVVPATSGYVTKVLGPTSPTAGGGGQSGGGILDNPVVRRLVGWFIAPIAGPIDLSRSEFNTPDAEGAPSSSGTKYHAALDIFGRAGTTVRAPVTGKVVEVTPSRGNSGQVYGGTVKVQAAGSGQVHVMRHVDPKGVRVGQPVIAGDPVATITNWQGGSSHVHYEIWKTLGGGYRFENMLDPAKVLGDARQEPPPPPQSAEEQSLWDALKAEIQKDTTGLADVVTGAADAVGGAADALNPATWARELVDTVLGWIAERALLSLAAVMLAGIALVMIVQGSSRAFGTPSITDAATLAATRGRSAAA